ncbi:hypothetical protein [Methylobacterium nodulans]|uniref:Uncharacterized protein n=1 Tax=Methylobacterium nodulans (strain LMG 21967 / CNCM I-2342 / ORS 2060) TaxID=460265 RepID=B8IQR5_METNO|nr:hypothetical protein [Methylobacterium nodulans]ACL62360.1 conserved hypothetical protein [Methylobacterium nodulans ORS 2060]
MAMSEPNLSVFDVKQLAELCDVLSTLKDVLLAIECQPRCETSTLGCFVEDEGTRYGLLRDRVADELSSRWASADEEDRHHILAVRVLDDLACGGRISDAELMTQLVQTWGRREAVSA